LCLRTPRLLTSTLVRHCSSQMCCCRLFLQIWR
jgi:hypothetical protein